MAPISTSPPFCLPERQSCAITGWHCSWHGSWLLYRAVQLKTDLFSTVTVPVTSTAQPCILRWLNLTKGRLADTAGLKPVCMHSKGMVNDKTSFWVHKTIESAREGATTGAGGGSKAVSKEKSWEEAGAGAVVGAGAGENYPIEVSNW